MEDHGVHEWGEAHGIPIITVERPGYGISTCREYHSVTDHAIDAQELILAKPGYLKVRVEGIKGAGPYALAFTSLCNCDMVAVTGFMCGAPPPQAPRGLISSAANFAGIGKYEVSSLFQQQTATHSVGS
jgi:hypothetical protein